MILFDRSIEQYHYSYEHSTRYRVVPIEGGIIEYNKIYRVNIFLGDFKRLEKSKY